MYSLHMKHRYSLPQGFNNFPSSSPNTFSFNSLQTVSEYVTWRWVIVFTFSQSLGHPCCYRKNIPMCCWMLNITNATRSFCLPWLPSLQLTTYSWTPSWKLVWLETTSLLALGVKVPIPPWFSLKTLGRTQGSKNNPFLPAPFSGENLNIVLARTFLLELFQ